MSKKFLSVFLATLLALPITIIGCKGRVEKTVEEMPSAIDVPEAMPLTPEEPLAPPAPRESAQTITPETIPPTAMPPQVTEKQPAVSQEKENRNKEIQQALKAAGFYMGPIDGKIGPKSKKAIEDFQRVKGLKVDGKVGPKTWAELEKYLSRE